MKDLIRISYHAKTICTEKFNATKPRQLVLDNKKTYLKNKIVSIVKTNPAKDITQPM